MSTTTQPVQSAEATSLPEFGDHRTCRTLFGFSRSSLYNLVSEGKIRSVSVRKSGAIKGRRLFDCGSIRNYLNSLAQAE